MTDAEDVERPAAVRLTVQFKLHRSFDAFNCNQSECCFGSRMANKPISEQLRENRGECVAQTVLTRLNVVFYCELHNLNEVKTSLDVRQGQTLFKVNHNQLMTFDFNQVVTS